MNELPPDPQDQGLLAGPPPLAPARASPVDPPVEPESTASGLDEKQIDAADLAALQAQFTFSSVSTALEAKAELLGGWQLPEGLDKRHVQTAALAIGAVRSAQMKLAPLPERIKPQQLRLPDLRAKLHRDLAPMLMQPIRRNRTDAQDLTKAEQDAVNKAFVAKYGSATKQLTLAGVFREVPLESAKSVRLDDTLRFCVFTLPPGTPVHKLHSGYALVVATGESGKTYPLLVRL